MSNTLHFHRVLAAPPKKSSAPSLIPMLLPAGFRRTDLSESLREAAAKTVTPDCKRTAP